jgi:hypothetical protein
MKKNVTLLSFILIAGLVLSSCGGNTESNTEPPGKEETTKTDILEGGAALLQGKDPFDRMNIYLVGFHPMKADPSHQMEAHHYCTQINEDFAQCVLFDGNTENAKLTGIEYIISERLFDSLPEEEKKYWHPHNYEILSGQLVAPGLPDIADKELMESKMNSYGKTWHVWSTGTAEGGGDDFPYGDPMLAWSFNRDGEAKPGLVENRDKRMGIDSEEKRQERKDLIPLAKPQEGVDALKGEFPGETESIIGVESKKTPKN